MLIFQGSNYVIDPNILAIIPFQKIWDADTHPKKEMAKCKLMWIYYMYNPRSTFRAVATNQKHAAILEKVFPKGVHEEWDPFKDELVTEAAEWYKAHVKKNPFWDTWNSYKKAMERLRGILENETSTIYEIAKARTELDAWPKSLKKMEEEAIKEDQVLDALSVKKDIKPGEELPSGTNQK